MNYRIKAYLSEKGMGTVEIVIIVAVLVGVALIFREAISKFVTDMIDSIFNDTEIIDKIKVG
ncbi:MAG: hypothetical protein JXN10_09390 [Clostridia bacterium]|nr:hypothetical protein [Clostridia bacterium]MBN2883732.1 hypothetical protein [Clostridia bacterium]